MHIGKFFSFLLIIFLGTQISSPTFSSSYNSNIQIDHKEVLHSIKITDLNIIDINKIAIGNGTLEEPFIIENLTINADKDYGIWIENVKAHFIIRNCKVYSKDMGITNRDIISNGTYHDQMYGIIMNYTYNSSIYGNVVYNTKYGIYIGISHNISIYNNVIYNTEYGIYIWTSNNISIFYNTIYKNIYGIHLESSSLNSIYYNTLSNNTDGIFLRWNYEGGNIIKGNKIYDHSNGISTDQEDNSEIIDNYIFNSTNGILADPFDNGIISNNTIINADIAIEISFGSSKNNIFNNIIHDNKVGISLLFLPRSNNVYNNIINNNSQIGIIINWVKEFNNISDNLIKNNPIGIRLNWTYKEVILRNNSIVDNDIGISFNWSDDHLVYNNYFDNNVNYYINHSFKIMWNTTKTLWGNIVGGPYLGGNYWSNYTGTDMDGDGLGDTDVPFGPGDRLPLIVLPIDRERPVIEDNTMDIPTTGDRFIFNASARDNRSVTRVYIEYWTDTTPHLNSTMNMVSGNPINGKYSFQTVMPSNSMKLYYFMSVRDFAGNWNRTPLKTLVILDNDLPTIKDMSGTPRTDNEYTFKFEIKDNIGISNSSVDYWFDDDNKTTVNMINSKAVIKVGSRALKLHYIAWTRDTSNNLVNLSGVRNIIDDTRPFIEDLSGIPYTGKDFRIICRVTDNRGIDRVMVSYWFSDQIKKGLMGQENDTYIYNVKIPIGARNLTYFIIANDANGNNITLNKTVKIIDIIKPSIEMNIGIPITGKEVCISVNTSDNWEISRTYLEYWFDEGTHINKSIEEKASFTIEVPTNSKELFAMVISYDSSENWDSYKIEQRVIDDIPPLILDMSNEPTTGDPYSISATLTDNIGINRSFLEY